MKLTLYRSKPFKWASVKYLMPNILVGFPGDLKENLTFLIKLFSSKWRAASELKSCCWFLLFYKLQSLWVFQCYCSFRASNPLDNFTLTHCNLKQHNRRSNWNFQISNETFNIFILLIIFFHFCFIYVMFTLLSNEFPISAWNLLLKLNRHCRIFTLTLNGRMFISHTRNFHAELCTSPSTSADVFTAWLNLFIFRTFCLALFCHCRRFLLLALRFVCC